MANNTPELLWQCHLCGLDTPEPSRHLEVHGFTLEQLMQHIDRMEQHRSELERIFLMSSELNPRTAGVCPTCGKPR